METLERNEWADVAQLVEITSDAVIICELDGTILHVNNRLLGLMCEERADVIGGDVKDVLYSSAFERATEHRLPFETDGSENELMLKLSDGSFIPVLVRAGSVTPPRIFGRRAPRVLVALHSIEEQHSHDRQLKRALSELRVANKRLSGTLSVIMSTVGSDELPSLLDTVLNQLVGTLDASGAAIYFSESGGFKLRGVSKELLDSYLPEFLPYGAGIPTYVLRESRTAARSVFPFFTVRRSLACWKLVGNAPRHRLPMTLMCSRSFAITCLSSWSAWHRAFAPVARPSLAARSMSCGMSYLPF